MTTRPLHASVDRDGNVNSVAHDLMTKFKIAPPADDETVFELLGRVAEGGRNAIGRKQT